MKKWLLSICCLLIIINAYTQNYRCIDPTVKRYFINSNYYLRGIRIDSVRTVGSDTILYPYKSPRGNYYTEKLKPKGSWLGETITIKTDGTTLFDNYWGDTAFIKTQAQVSDTWILYNDTGSTYYTATITSIDTMTVLGAIDSVKTITIAAMNNLGIVTTDPYNNIKLILSKQYGLVQTIDLYTFPYSASHGKDYFAYISNGIVFNLTVFRNANASELYDFQSGDVLEYKKEYSGSSTPTFYTTFFSIKNKFPTPTNEARYARDIREQKYSPVPPYSFTNTSISDTVTISLQALIDTSKMPEEIGQKSGYYYNPSDTSFCYTSDEYILLDNFISNDGSVNTFEPCGKQMVYKKGLGRIRYDECTDPTPGNFISERLIFAYKNGKGCGNYQAFVSIPNIIIKQVNIYPNPANETVTIETTENSTISLVNTLGQVVMQVQSANEKTTLSLIEIQSGIYYIRITDRNGVVKMQKLSVQK